jgi:hypothetical protein
VTTLAEATRSTSGVLEVPLADWYGRLAAPMREAAVSAVETGDVLFFPRLAFLLQPEEHRFLTVNCSDGKHKNISFDRATGRISGARGSSEDRAALAAMISRFADGAHALCKELFAQCEPPPRIMRTSYRPFPTHERATSWRKDDRRLHVDAFPSRPNRGERILRVFSNVHPEGAPRIWYVGEPFEAVARRFWPRLRPPLPGTARLLAAVGVTKGVRTAYDHCMLQLHDAMKRDVAYQRDAPRREVAFPGGSTWVCFSDQVSHAAVRGQYMLEQTLQVPVEAQHDPARSPLRVLERLARRTLA